MQALHYERILGRREVSMKNVLRTLGFTAMLAAAAAFAADDVGLINHLSGDVTYTSGKSTTNAKPFMKVREGDRFSVAAGAQLRVVYFRGGRQESYAGPASFTTGAQQSALQSGAQPQVSTLPPGAP